MLGLMLYAIVCFTIACAITWVTLLFTKLGTSAERPSIVRLILMWAIIFSIPYGWVEVSTKMYADDFAEAIEDATAKDFLAGRLAYFKVRNAVGGTARILAVTELEEEWGGVYRNLYDLEFARDEEGWHLLEITSLNAQDGDSAGFSVPPYW